METTTGEICCRLCFCSNGNFLNIFNDVPSVFDIAELLKKYFQDEVSKGMHQMIYQNVNGGHLSLGQTIGSIAKYHL